MTATQIMAAITTAKQAEQIIKVLVTKANKKWPKNELFAELSATMAAILPILLIMLLACGCMTYVREVNLADSPVHVEGIRGSVNAQIGVQTRGQHIPGAAEDVVQEGGGRADTQATIPVDIDRSTSTSATDDSASSASPRDDQSSDEPVTPASDTNSVTLRWLYGGFDGSSATLDAGLALSDAQFSASGVTYAHTAYPADWAGNAIACLFVLDASGAAATGGKFDWAPADRTARDWKNVRGGYSGGGVAWVEPAAGAQVLFGLWSVDGSRRSNLVAGTWRRQ